MRSWSPPSLVRIFESVPCIFLDISLLLSHDCFLTICQGDPALQNQTSPHELGKISRKTDLQVVGQLRQPSDAGRFFSPLRHHLCSHLSDFISDILLRCPGIPDISCGCCYKTSDFLGQGQSRGDFITEEKSWKRVTAALRCLSLCRWLSGVTEDSSHLEDGCRRWPPSDNSPLMLPSGAGGEDVGLMLLHADSDPQPSPEG